MFFHLLLVVLLNRNVDGSCSLKDRTCFTPNGSKGLCVPAQYCSNVNVNTPLSDLLKNSLCGRDVDNSDLFCCDVNALQPNLPNENKNQIPSVASQSIANVGQNELNRIQDTGTINPVQQHVSTTQLPVEPLLPSQPQPDYCQTPNGDQAQCLPIFYCLSILSVFQNNSKNEDALRYSRESKCDYHVDGTIRVCCGKDVNFRRFKEDEENENFTYNDLIPTNKNCGLKSELIEQPVQPITLESRSGLVLNFTLPNRIFGGRDTEVNEFPWVALLEYQSPNEEKLFQCGGSLISSRYVLTAAHCIIVQTIVNVRLGEWNYQNEGPDCITTNRGRLCIAAPINVGVESVHPHPNYKHNILERYNDIGLIRMVQNIKFTNFITPICLPYTNDYVTPGNTLTLSGWGLKSYSEQTTIKQKIDLPIIPRSQCSIMFEKSPKLRKLGRGQFCAGGESGKDACTGDSGGPLMKQVNSSLGGPARWYLEGVVSFGHGCGMQNHYGIYTTVSKYIGWIHRTVVP